MATLKRRLRRRGATFVEWCLVAGAVILVVVIAVGTMGTRTDAQLEQTATEVGDPSQLPARFGN
jgi:Flp pilus assembly pilin Flp